MPDASGSWHEPTDFFAIYHRSIVVWPSLHKALRHDPFPRTER